MEATAKQCCNCGQELSDLLPRLKEIISDYKNVKGPLIPVLQLAQGLFGYLPKEALRMISEELSVPYSEVTGVVSFYSFFSTKPRGKHLIRVCLGTACYVRGGKNILEALKKNLKVDVGETTEDKLFTLDVGRCFGACGLAPVVMVDDDTFQRVKPSRVQEIVDAYREKNDE